MTKTRMDPDAVQEVLERDRNRCVVCGSDERIQIAHIRSRGARPDLINEPTNLCCLCWTCHGVRQHTEGIITSAALERILALRYGIVYSGDTGALAPKDR
jgi:hypothetical protein